MLNEYEYRQVGEGLAALLAKNFGHFAHKVVNYPLRNTFGQNGKAAETFVNALVLYLFGKYALANSPQFSELVKNIALKMIPFAVDEFLVANNMLNFEEYYTYEDYNQYSYQIPEENVESYEYYSYQAPVIEDTVQTF